MPYHMRWVFVFAGLFSICGAIGAALGDEPTITVRGEASVKLVPDQVLLQVGIESREKTVGEAVEVNNRKIQKVMEFLKTSGVSQRDIERRHLSLEPIARSQQQVFGKFKQQVQLPPPQNNAPNASPFGNEGDDHDENNALSPTPPIGYLARRQIRITINKLEKFEAIYQGLFEMEGIRIDGVRYQSSESDDLQEKVRLAAVSDARLKAQAMAGELGATVASVQTMQEVGHVSDDIFPRAPRSSTYDDPFGGPRATTEEYQISTSVTVVFLLGETTMKKPTK